ncbi:hypothetical protein L6R46_20790 [Myxococcota bacterium]|nr:hypothetical protein [Myxococcota bacterium]
MWLIILTLIAPALAGDLTFTPSPEATTEVRWTDGDAAVVLERFPAAEEVVGFEVSADGKSAFVWHRPNGKSLRVSTYDLHSKKRIATFSPGFGGQLQFSAAGTLILTHGCGTNCHVLTVFDLLGNKLVGVGGTIHDVSPARRYALVYPTTDSDPGPVTLYDLATGQRLAEFTATESGEIGVEALRWATGESAVIVTLVSRSGGAQPRYLRLGVDGTVGWVAAP